MFKDVLISTDHNSQSQQYKAVLISNKNPEKLRQHIVSVERMDDDTDDNDMMMMVGYIWSFIEA